jgi:hypothetical protein
MERERIMLHRSPKKRLLALLLALSLVAQMGASAWAVESSVDQEGMLSVQESVSQEAVEEEEAAQAETEAEAETELNPLYTGDRKQYM